MILRPLRREFADDADARRELALSGKKVTKATPAASRTRNAVFQRFLDRLRRVRVLDPACGSGNFLIVACGRSRTSSSRRSSGARSCSRRPMQFPQIGPEAVLGIELNAYAAELARVTIWIGEIQWMIRHGLGYRRDPILKSLNHIENRDALLDLTDPSKPQEARWPEAEFIVGNPPFLGGSCSARGLGDAYVGGLWSAVRRADCHADRTSATGTRRREPRSSATRTSARACWRRKASAAAPTDASSTHQASRATSSLRAPMRPWVLRAPTVHISFVGQDDGPTQTRTLDGIAGPSDQPRPHHRRRPHLRASARRVPTSDSAFMGDTKGGPSTSTSRRRSELLAAPNPDGRSNSDVVRPWVNALDLTRRPRACGSSTSGRHVGGRGALYEAPLRVCRG